jgi:hypothetical protein
VRLPLLLSDVETTTGSHVCPYEGDHAYVMPIPRDFGFFCGSWSGAASAV